MVLIAPPARSSPNSPTRDAAALLQHGMASSRSNISPSTTKLTNVSWKRSRSDHSSYYTRQNAQSAALLRARRPYLVKNAVAGVLLFGIAGGVCT